jgi:hypothetical protein
LLSLPQVVALHQLSGAAAHPALLACAGAAAPGAAVHWPCIAPGDALSALLACAGAGALAPGGLPTALLTANAGSLQAAAQAASLHHQLALLQASVALVTRPCFAARLG